MSKSPFSLSGITKPALYPVIAAALMAIQYGYAAICLLNSGLPIVANAGFWLSPMPTVMDVLLQPRPALVSGGFFICLLASVFLGIFSFRRANFAGRGHWLAQFALVPTIQLGAIFALAVLPRSTVIEPLDQAAEDRRGDQRQALIGVGGGMVLIVAAVIVSANMLGAYGLGLFVFTPLLVGFTTGYSVNSPQPTSKSRTGGLVVLAGLLGTLTLLMFALEGFMCIVLIAPLAALLGLIGGLIGRALALRLRHPGHPLFSIAILPLALLIDSALPPAVVMNVSEDIVIAATPVAIWKALISNRPVDREPGLVGLAGLAVPIASHLTGEGVGALRVGTFSTGTARERITLWQPRHALAFRGESHAPAMEEMSPYRIVHAPHVDGYFDTLETRFILTPLAGGHTRLTVKSRHILRIEPIPYWQPIARWAIQQNMRRVLLEIGDHALVSQ